MDKSLITFFSGLIVGLLVTTGWLSPTNAQQATDGLTTAFGAIITIVTISGMFIHLIHSSRHGQQTTTTTVTPTMPTHTGDYVGSGGAISHVVTETNLPIDNSTGSL